MTRIIAVDWSGAQGEQRSHKRIAVAEWAESAPSLKLSCGWSREQVVGHVIRRAHADPQLVVGFDFAFSFPEWFAKILGPDIATVWEAARASGESWLSQAPFWSLKRPRAIAGQPAFRATDRAGGVGSPKSIFQNVGNGQVGRGSVRGMKYLADLREAGFSIWPFDPARLPMVVEIYPTACYPNGNRRDIALLRTQLSAAGLEPDTGTDATLARVGGCARRGLRPDAHARTPRLLRPASGIL